MVFALSLRSAARGTVLLALGAGLSAVSCAATEGNRPLGASGGGGPDAASSSSGAGGGDLFTTSSGGGGSVLPGAGGGGPSGDCAENAKLIYIVGQGNNLYSFYPPTLEVKSIGVIQCPQGGGFATPFSMAVDRDAIAWVLFSDGRIYHVDTSDASCAATAFSPGQQGLSTFGMGFASDAIGSASETLFIADYFGSGIASIDTTTLAVSPVEPFDSIFTAAELTGTGDARLYGFFQGSPIVIAEIDKSNGHILSGAPQPSIDIGTGWAFAFWGGDFYTFTNPTGFGSQIDKYSPSMQTTTTIKTGLGDNIVGAGVSTCAPTTPPPN